MILSPLLHVLMHSGLLLRLSWRAWLCPNEDQCGDGAAAWITWALQVPSTLGDNSHGPRRYGAVRVFLASRGSSVLVRIVHGDGTASWIAGNNLGPGVQETSGHGCRRQCAIRNFSSLWKLVFKGLP